MADIRFEGRVAVVTGAGAGLGRVYALNLAKRGASVVVNDLGVDRYGSGEGSNAPADEVAEEIRNAGGEATANYDSVTTPEGGENIIKTAVEAYGKVDILINNAGILNDKTFVKMEPVNWKAVMSVHLDGAYYVTRPAFKVMRENNYGRIVMTTSSAGLYGNFGQANYAAAKMGLVGLMHTLKLEGAKYNIKINAIAPMAVSRMTEDLMSPAMAQKTSPELVAPMVVYLCSEQNPDSGLIYFAGAGVFCRVAILTGAPLLLGNGEGHPSAEEVMAKIDEVKSLENAQEHASLEAQFALLKPYLA